MQLGKNTYDIALALDAIEAFFDQRVDAFCLVTSDSDFVHLCKKLRERGAMVYIVGEEKTPAALRNTCDQFFVWTKPTQAIIKKSDIDTSSTQAMPKQPSLDFVATAVEIMSAQREEGRVGLGALGQFLKRTDPAFTPKTFGHSGWLALVKSDSRFFVFDKDGGSYVSLRSTVTQEIKELLDEQQ
jgi:predicted nuclease of predicted toxin-antitoxin system